MSALQETLSELVALSQYIQNQTDDKPRRNSKSLSNLKAYLKLRTRDITHLQYMLSKHGLSSFGRSQSCIMHSIYQDIAILAKLTHSNPPDTPHCEYISYDEAQDLMYEKSKVFGNNNTVFEHPQHIFKTRVMITLPSEAKDSQDLIGQLIASGANILRINTAHDTPKDWQQMANFIHAENIIQNKNTKIYVDLAGPKNRTGKIRKEALSFKVGSSKKPEYLAIVAHNKNSKTMRNAQGMAQIVVDATFLKALEKHSSIKIYDTSREKFCDFEISKKDEVIVARIDKKIVIDPQTIVKTKNIQSTLFDFEQAPQKIVLSRYGKIILTPQQIEGCMNFEFHGTTYAALISCTNTGIFKHIHIGDTIYIDDGKIGCTVIEHIDLGIICEVFLAKEGGVTLKEEKGINFPQTMLQIDAITQEDEANFEHICNFADIIGISFAQSADDIKKLKSMLESKNLFHVAIAPKIETRLGLKNLPNILEELLDWEQYALMIARGDLAIEIGFDHLPYVQEEIFSICEAAHVPVIYATQILEGKMKNNLPSRSEVTDAAFAQRADCVMLNKGAFVLQTVETLKQILRSMHTIFQKNRQLLSKCELFD